MKIHFQQQVYIAFLRGINVGGHHKVPMSELKFTLTTMGFSDIKTLLNSGNVVFKANPTELKILEEQMAEHLEKKFGFPVPVLIREMETIRKIIVENPYKEIQLTENLRLYVTFLKAPPKENMEIPWISADGAFQLLAIKDKTIFSVLDVSKSQTTDAMKILEKAYSKDITTRNWNTIVKIASL